MKLENNGLEKSNIGKNLWLIFSTIFKLFRKRAWNLNPINDDILASDDIPVMYLTFPLPPEDGKNGIRNGI
jgi:hypothetical protein